MIKIGNSLMAKNKAKPIKKPQNSLDVSNPDSLFFSSFIGEWVEIMCRNTSIDIPGGRFPVTLGGYLLDIDEEHLYTSQNGKEITGAIKRKDYISIQVAKEYTESELMLDSVNIPEDRETGN